jgi:hypothetical protein
MPYTLRPNLPACSYTCKLQSDRMVLLASICFQWKVSAPPMPHMSEQSLDFIAECLGILAIRHLTIHKFQCSIWQLWMVDYWVVAHALCQVPRQLHVASPSFLLRLLNLDCTCLPQHLNSLSLNQFSIINISPMQPCLESLQTISNHHLPLQGYMSKLFWTVLSADNGMMLLHQTPSHPYHFPVVEGTRVGQPIVLSNCFQENSTCFKQTGTLASAPPKCDKSSLSLSVSYLWGEISGNRGKWVIRATSVLRGSAAIITRFSRWLIGGHLGVLVSCPGAVAADKIRRMTGLSPCSGGGTWVAPGDDGPCPVNG